MESIIVDGNDADAVYRVAQTAYAKARSGGGPSLIEAKTYRQCGHSRADPGAYRPDEEVEEWLARDPIPAYRRRLLDFGFAESAVDGIEAEVLAAVDAATDAARASPPPPPEILETESLCRWRRGMAELTCREAVAAAIAQEMRRDPSVVFLGEDIGAAGGVFKTTVGLFEEFGPERVRDTPISEQAIIGAAMGAAMTGLRPIAERSTRRATSTRATAWGTASAAAVRRSSRHLPWVFPRRPRTQRFGACSRACSPRSTPPPTCGLSADPLPPDSSTTRRTHIARFAVPLAAAPGSPRTRMRVPRADSPHAPPFRGV